MDGRRPLSRSVRSRSCRFAANSVVAALTSTSHRHATSSSACRDLISVLYLSTLRSRSETFFASRCESHPITDPPRVPPTARIAAAICPSIIFPCFSLPHAPQDDAPSTLLSVVDSLQPRRDCVSDISIKFHGAYRRGPKHSMGPPRLHRFASVPTPSSSHQTSAISAATRVASSSRPACSEMRSTCSAV